MNKIVVEITDDINAKLAQIAKITNMSIEDVVQNALNQYTDEVLEDYMLAKIAQERMQDIDKAVEVSLDEL